MRVQDVVLIVKEVHDSFGPLAVPVSITKIKSYITDRLGVQIETFDRGSWQAKLILGRLHRYEKEGRRWAKIIVSDSLNHCWTRFVACKELAHLLIDKRDEDCTTDPIGLIRNLVGMLPTTIEADVNSERLATIAAVELLVPWSQRNVISQMLAEQKSNYEIAVEFRVPERVIEFWQTPDYQGLLSKAWADIA